MVATPPLYVDEVLAAAGLLPVESAAWPDCSAANPGVGSGWLGRFRDAHRCVPDPRDESQVKRFRAALAQRGDGVHVVSGCRSRTNRCSQRRRQRTGSTEAGVPPVGRSRLGQETLSMDGPSATAQRSATCGPRTVGAVEVALGRPNTCGRCDDNPAGEGPRRRRGSATRASHQPSSLVRPCA